MRVKTSTLGAVVTAIVFSSSLSCNVNAIADAHENILKADDPIYSSTVWREKLTRLKERRESENNDQRDGNSFEILNGQHVRRRTKKENGKGNDKGKGDKGEKGKDKGNDKGNEKGDKGKGDKGKDKNEKGKGDKEDKKEKGKNGKDDDKKEEKKTKKNSPVMLDLSIFTCDLFCDGIVSHCDANTVEDCCPTNYTVCDASVFDEIGSYHCGANKEYLGRCIENDIIQHIVRGLSLSPSSAFVSFSLSLSLSSELFAVL
jgi:hypothetical protein